MHVWTLLSALVTPSWLWRLCHINSMIITIINWRTDFDLIPAKQQRSKHWLKEECILSIGCDRIQPHVSIVSISCGADVVQKMCLRFSDGVLGQLLESHSTSSSVECVKAQLECAVRPQAYPEFYSGGDSRGHMRNFQKGAEPRGSWAEVRDAGSSIWSKKTSAFISMQF